jgi:hypothetical protein
MSDFPEIRDYLLGRLSPQRQEQVENKIFSDDDFHEEVEIVEEELLDQYARGEITGEEKRFFEQHFLASPLRKQKLAFSQALQTKANSPERIIPRPVSTFYLYALAACVLSLVALGLVSYRLSNNLRQQRDRTAQLIHELEDLRKTISQVPAGDLASQPLQVAKLSPGILRGGTALSRISVPDGIRAIQFALRVPVNIEGETSVELLDDAGGLITNIPGSLPQKIGQHLVVIATFDRKFLKPGNYFIQVNPLATPSSKLRYSFQID